MGQWGWGPCRQVANHGSKHEAGMALPACVQSLPGVGIGMAWHGMAWDELQECQLTNAPHHLLDVGDAGMVQVEPCRALKVQLVSWQVGHRHDRHDCVRNA